MPQQNIPEYAEAAPQLLLALKNRFFLFEALFASFLIPFFELLDSLYCSLNNLLFPHVPFFKFQSNVRLFIMAAINKLTRKNFQSYRRCQKDTEDTKDEENQKHGMCEGEEGAW